MKKHILLFQVLYATLSFSQTETEIIGINYSNYSKSNYLEDIYTTTTQKTDAFINYGHKLGKKFKLFYHASIQNFNLGTKTNYDDISQDDFILYPNVPNYALITLATGIKNDLKNNWKLTNFITFTLADDLSNKKLKKNNYFRTFSFLTKKKSNHLKYGFGVYLDNVKEDIQVLPILSLELKNEKRGFNLFFPRSLKLWQKVTKKSYLELKSNIDSNTLIAENFEDLNFEIFSINTDLSYNYLIKNKFKIKAGFGLPYREYEYKLNTTNFKTVQKPAINFNLGFSYVVFQE